MFLTLIFAAVSILSIFSCPNAQDERLGVGVMVGEPIALTIKYWDSNSSAYVVSFGVSCHRDNYYACAFSQQQGYECNPSNKNWLHCNSPYSLNNALVQIDYLYHNFLVLPLCEKTPFHYGYGVRVGFVKDKSLNIRNAISGGIRFPVGFSWIHGDNHIDLFIELVPVMVMIPYYDVKLNGGAGVRYYF